MSLFLEIVASTICGLILFGALIGLVILSTYYPLIVFGIPLVAFVLLLAAIAGAPIFEGLKKMVKS